jgi:hypothetical protein
MPRNWPWAACIAALFLFWGGLLAGESSAGGANVEVVAPVHQFDPVVEGVAVSHRFEIANRGDETLQILAVRSG